MTVHPAPPPVSEVSGDAGTTAGRVLGAIQVALGLATVVRARRIATDRWWRLGPGAMAGVVAVLGARQIVQGAVTLSRPGPDVILAGAGVDLLHAASMVPVALVPCPYRSAAATSAALATATAAAAVAVHRTARS